MTSEYTDRIEKAIEKLKWSVEGDTGHEALDILKGVLQEMSDDIESLRNKSHDHDYDR